MTMRWLAVALTVLALGLAAAGCGSTSGSTGTGSGSGSAAAGTTHFAKTKFVLHAGLAFGAFHRYIYKPYKQGKFSGGLFHHKLATVKAALAAAFAYHEVKLALADARSSKLLSKALSPLLALQTRLSSMTSALKHGDVNGSSILQSQGDTTQISSAGAAAGQPVHDLATSSLG